MAVDPSFRLTIANVSFVTGRGTIATGLIEQGTLKIGDEVQLRQAGTVRLVVVASLEASRKLLPEAKAGERVGVLLRGVGKAEVHQGDVLAGSDAE